MAIDNQKTQIIIEDHVVPQLLTSAIEAYEHGDTTSQRGRVEDRLETFGLLWGYVLPARDSVPARIVAVTSTVETSAYRHKDWVRPNPASIKAKREFFEKFWPNLELVGTYHSHPYENLKAIQEVQGWRASEEGGDKDYWPDMHEEVCEEYDYLAHLVVSIVGLDRKSSAWPGRLEGGESMTGYTLGAGSYRIWVKSYSTEKEVLATYIHEDEDGDAKVDEGDNDKVEAFGFEVSQEDYVLDSHRNILSYDDIADKPYFHVNEDIELHIPSLENRFSAHVNGRF
jgi:hypothetical protein